MSANAPAKPASEFGNKRILELGQEDYSLWLQTRRKRKRMQYLFQFLVVFFAVFVLMGFHMYQTRIERLDGMSDPTAWVVLLLITIAYSPVFFLMRYVYVRNKKEVRPIRDKILSQFENPPQWHETGTRKDVSNDFWQNKFTAVVVPRSHPFENMATIGI
ncbi:MAG: hypothetical protein AAB597_01170 [Patescibacteria group bacterium]